jgi:hypothetical protein
MSAGYSRKLSGVPVRSLKLCRHAAHRKVWWPSAVVLGWRVVVGRHSAGRASGILNRLVWCPTYQRDSLTARLNSESCHIPWDDVWLKE